jgi:hypothetical protein
MLPLILVLAPMYGGGALLVRELVRREGRGWPSIILLALGYAILEEAFTTQSLFNPNYLSLNLHLLEPSYIAALGIGAWWTIFVLTLHTAWSISASIALVEAAAPGRAVTPWLGGVGLSVTVLLFALGIVSNTLIGYKQDHFKSTPAQLTVSAAIMIALVVAAFRLPRTSAARVPGWTPGAWAVGALALAAGSGVLLVPQQWGWWGFAAILGIDAGMAVAILAWGKRAGWDLRHKLALGGGAALAYGWHAFVQKPVMGGTGVDVRLGNAIFLLGAVALITFAARRTRDRGTQPPFRSAPRSS